MINPILGSFPYGYGLVYEKVGMSAAVGRNPVDELVILSLGDGVNLNIGDTAWIIGDSYSRKCFVRVEKDLDGMVACRIMDNGFVSRPVVGDWAWCYRK